MALRNHDVSPEKLAFIKKRLAELPKGSRIKPDGTVIRMGTGPWRGEKRQAPIHARLAARRCIALYDLWRSQRKPG